MKRNDRIFRSKFNTTERTIEIIISCFDAAGVTAQSRIKNEPR